MGGLDLAVFDSSVLEEERRYRYTDISFSVEQWDAFVNDVIGDFALELPDRELRDIEYDQKEKEVFESALSGFPLLSRISDYYSDAAYDPLEISQLLNECNLIMARLKSTLATDFITGLIKGCYEATNTRAGLVLIAD